MLLEQEPMFSLLFRRLRIESAMERQRGWHEQGRTAVMALEPRRPEGLSRQRPRVVYSWIGSILRSRCTRISMAHSIV